MNQNHQSRQSENIFKIRKSRPGRDQLDFEKMLERKQGVRYAVNPESKYHKKHRQIKLNKHQSKQYQHLRRSVDIEVPSFELPQLNTPKSPEEKCYKQACEQVLQVRRAKELVLRLQKQKQYNEGKYLFMRRKQEDRKDKEEKRLLQERKQQQEVYRSHRMRRIIENILVHEERINLRIGESLNRLKKSQLRSNTESGAEAYSPNYSIRMQSAESKQESPFCLSRFSKCGLSPIDKSLK